MIYGLAIYYFLPLSLLSLNFSLILRIFFFILLAMLFGLTLLSFNLQRVLEIILVYVLLCFEKQSMKNLVLKNLTAHKMRNKMTSIIFSLALGFIIFLIVSANLQIKSSQLLNLRRRGAYLQLSSGYKGIIEPKALDSILRNQTDKLDSFAYTTYDMSKLETQKIKTIQISDRAQINKYDAAVFGVIPSVFDATIDDFLKVRYKVSGLPQLGESLYSTRGMQGIGVGSFLAR